MIVQFLDAATGIPILVETTRVVKCVELGQDNGTGFFPVTAIACANIDDVLVRGDLATTAAVLSSTPGTAVVVGMGTYTPVFAFTGPLIVNVQEPWSYESFFDGTVQRVNVKGRASFDNFIPGTPETIQADLPIIPLAPFPYPAALCGSCVPNGADALSQGFASQFPSVVEAQIGTLKAQFLLMSVDGKPQAQVFDFTYRSQ